MLRIPKYRVLVGARRIKRLPQPRVLISG
jgi:hypothetical protein